MPASSLAHAIMLAVFCLFELGVGCLYLYATCNGAGAAFLLLPAIVFGAFIIYRISQHLAWSLGD